MKNNKRQYLVADAILDVLKAHWVDTIFWYPGWAILPFYDVLNDHKKDIKHILVRNEQAAGFAAQGYTRSTKRLWVCCSTSWPWATNLITAIADAYLDSIPILCITGQVPLWTIWKDMFQEVDMTWITLNITKHNYLVKKAEDIVPIVTQAIYIALNWRPWPVHIDVPKDIMASAHPEKFEIPKIDLSETDPFKKAYHSVEIDVIDKVLKSLKSAKRPVLLIGQWVKHSKAEERLNEFVDKSKIPTVSTILWKWIIKDSNPNYHWMLWMHWFYEANKAVANADLILNIWSRFDDRIVWRYDSFWKDAKIIHVDIDQSEINKVVNVDMWINCDANLFLKEILSHPDFWGFDMNSWMKTINDWKKQKPYKSKTSSFTIRSVLNWIMDEVRENPENYIIVSDVGQHMMWSALSIKVPKSTHWFASWWAWTMWFALPACMWAAKANPDKVVICIVGDWWIQMNIQELQTLKDYNFNIKVCILNNNFLWMVRQWQELFYSRNYSQVLISSPDYQKLADAYWLDGYLVNSQDDLKKVHKDVFSSKKPQVIEYKVKKEDNVYPMVPGGSTLGEMITE